MPAIKFDNGQCSSVKHRSGSVLNGCEDDNDAARLNAFVEENECRPVAQIDHDKGPSQGYRAKPGERLDQDEMKSYVEKFVKSCNSCGMIGKEAKPILPNPVSEELKNGSVQDPHSDMTITTDETSTNLVKARVSFFERKDDNLDRVVSASENGKCPHIANGYHDQTNNNEDVKSGIVNGWKNFPVETKATTSGKPSGCPFSGKKELKTIRLKNYVKSNQTIDNLHTKSKATHCSAGRCMGSLMQPYGGVEHDTRPYGMARPREQVKEQAADFMALYFEAMKKKNPGNIETRLNQVYKEIDETGTYQLTYDELSYGARLAWRNAPRCIGRIQWNNLKLFDARHVTTPRGMFEALLEHIEYASNGGNLRSAITVFRERREDMKDFRLWNSQLIRYAGYRQEDGSVIGDPVNVDFTKLCEKLGWKGRGGMFDVLPWILEVGGQPPECFEIPDELVLQVKIKHPDYPWFADFGLQWYALPGVSNMVLDVGGVEFPASPFNGWYMVTEVGARDLGDAARYNMLEPIAKGMNLDTKTNTSLWKDRAVTELNYAVLHSFGEAKVTISDHHTASETFIKHMENEHRLRGGCPADWVWIVPPSSGSTTEVFHQEMLNYSIKPSYEYQEDAWRHYKFDDADEKKVSFKQAAKFVQLVKSMMNKIMAKRQKATILYATETGKSESFANMLHNLYSQAFDVKTICMSDYDLTKLNQENMLVIVTSTFGNGEAPMNGEEFGDALYKLMHPGNSDTQNGILANIDEKYLKGVRYAVFGLGSRAYPNFCAFAHSCRKLLKQLGAAEFHVIGEGDELCGQEDSFKKWAKAAFKSACDVFSIDQSSLKGDAGMESSKIEFDPKNYRFQFEDPSSSLDFYKGLSTVHGKQVHEAEVISVEELQSEDSGRSTVLIRLRRDNSQDLAYEPGDHLSVFARNEADIVEKLIGQLTDAPSPDAPIRIETCSQSAGNKKTWEHFSRLPAFCTLREAFTSFIDITTPPTQEMLRIFAKQATDKADQDKLSKLAEDTEEYEDWKFDYYPNMSETVGQFPSLKLNGLELLALLPILQCRYYSISSAPLMYPDEIHATVAVLSYETQAEPKSVHHGVCSYWMASLKPGDTVPCYIRQATSFRLPKETDAPVIMIGPGTGIAPLRGFWQQRQVMRQNDKNANWGPMDLYFGCRASNHDDLFKEEKKQAVDDGTLNNVRLALSREPGVEKTYVQHLVKQDSKHICEKLIEKNGHIYVCGDVAMAADVNKTISDVLQENLKYSKDQARDCIKMLKTNGRYHEDIFGVTKIPARSKHLDK